MPKTKFIRVARSGNTVDGREITAAQIDEMAATYDPNTYGARVNMEHLLSYFPDSPFRSYGDVLALKAEDGPDGSRVLLAQIDATADLVKLAQDRQKVYWSIEMLPNFAQTGKAYMSGLAVTDSPASLGTEMLTFAAKNDKASAALKAKHFSVPVDAALDIDDTTEKPAGEKPAGFELGIMDKVKELLSGKSKTDVARFEQIEAAMTLLAEKIGENNQAQPDIDDAQKGLQELTAKFDDLKVSVDDLTAKLSNTPAAPQRQPASGIDTQTTDC